MYILNTRSSKGLMVYKPKKAIHKDIVVEALEAEPTGDSMSASIENDTSGGAEQDLSMLGSGFAGIRNKKIVSNLHDKKVAKNKFTKFINLQL